MFSQTCFHCIHKTPRSREQTFLQTKGTNTHSKIYVYNSVLETEGGSVLETEGGSVLETGNVGLRDQGFSLRDWGDLVLETRELVCETREFSLRGWVG